jgi:hypothetical protein
MPRFDAHKPTAAAAAAAAQTAVAYVCRVSLGVLQPTGSANAWLLPLKCRSFRMHSVYPHVALSFSRTL